MTKRKGRDLVITSAGNHAAEKQIKKMNTYTNIASAIARSASHTEIVRVEVAEIAAALAEVNAHCEDYDHTDANEGEDVWGTTEDGSEFRLMLVVAK